MVCPGIELERLQADPAHRLCRSRRVIGHTLGALNLLSGWEKDSCEQHCRREHPYHPSFHLPSSFLNSSLLQDSARGSTGKPNLRPCHPSPSCCSRISAGSSARGDLSGKYHLLFSE